MGTGDGYTWLRALVSDGILGYGRWLVMVILGYGHWLVMGILVMDTG